MVINSESVGISGHFGMIGDSCINLSDKVRY